MYSALSGATIGLSFVVKEDIAVAVSTLLTCEDHDGVHHFAVTGEGRTLWCSPTGWECIEKSKVLPFTIDHWM